MKGDLNVVQHEALQWTLIEEAEQEGIKFDTALRFTVLSGMNPQLYKTVWPEENEDDKGIDWMVPTNAEEAQDLEQLFAELDSLSDSEKSIVPEQP